MNNKNVQSVLLIITGIIIIGAGLFIYFVANTIYPNSGSSRVQDLNWLLKTFGRLGSSILICAIGLIPVYAGLKKMSNKK